MAAKSDTFHVLIASPSDLTEEREVVRDAVNRWNALHSAEMRVVLLPVMWETHAMPVAGVRPQEAINDQLVAESDILIGMFWTKLGTNTGVAASGTVEEIDQFVKSGKPVMLYLSDRPVCISTVDIAQLNLLKNFKNETYKNALVGNFKSAEELRWKISESLTRLVRKLLEALPAAPEKPDTLASPDRVSPHLRVYVDTGIDFCTKLVKLTWARNAGAPLNIGATVRLVNDGGSSAEDVSLTIELDPSPKEVLCSGEPAYQEPRVGSYYLPIPFRMRPGDSHVACQLVYDTDSSFHAHAFREFLIKMVLTVQSASQRPRVFEGVLRTDGRDVKTTELSERLKTA